jgi:hypothetical protein
MYFQGFSFILLRGSWRVVGIGCFLWRSRINFAQRFSMVFQKLELGVAERRQARKALNLAGFLNKIRAQKVFYRKDCTDFIHATH